MTGNFMADYEAELLAAANTPERIAADAALMERNSRRMKAELEALERQGLIDHGSEDDDDEDEADASFTGDDDDD